MRPGVEVAKSTDSDVSSCRIRSQSQIPRYWGDALAIADSLDIKTIHWCATAFSRRNDGVWTTPAPSKAMLRWNGKGQKQRKAAKRTRR